MTARPGLIFPQISQAAYSLSIPLPVEVDKRTLTAIMLMNASGEGEMRMNRDRLDERFKPGGFDGTCDGVRTIGEVLEELWAQYLRPVPEIDVVGAEEAIAQV